MNKIASRSYSRPGCALARWACVRSTNSSSSLPVIASPHGQFRCVFTLPPFGSFLSCRLFSLHVLLVRTDLVERTRIGDVRDRHVRASLTEFARGRPPTLGSHGVLLAEQCQKYLRLLLAEPGQAVESSQQLGSVGVTGGPYPGRIAVVTIYDDLRERLYPLGHRARKAVYRRLFRAQVGEFVRVVVGDLGRVAAAHTIGDLLRAGECGLHGHLLVEQ